MGRPRKPLWPPGHRGFESHTIRLGLQEPPSRAWDSARGQPAGCMAYGPRDILLQEADSTVSTKISAEESSVGAIFTDSYRFTVPPYQRPYAWTTEQAGEMFDDLHTAATAKPSLAEADPYFLGSIVLVKPEGQAEAEIVPGNTVRSVDPPRLRCQESRLKAPASEQRRVCEGSAHQCSSCCCLHTRGSSVGLGPQDDGQFEGRVVGELRRHRPPGAGAGLDRETRQALGCCRGACSEFCLHLQSVGKDGSSFDLLLERAETISYGSVEVGVV